MPELPNNKPLNVMLTVGDINNLIVAVNGYLEFKPKRSLEENYLLSGLGLYLHTILEEARNAPAPVEEAQVPSAEDKAQKPVVKATPRAPMKRSDRKS